MERHRRALSHTLLALLALAACDGARGAPAPSPPAPSSPDGGGAEAAVDLDTFIEPWARLSEEDKGLLRRFLVRRGLSEGLGHPLPEVSTVEEAVTLQRAFEAKRDLQRADTERDLEAVEAVEEAKEARQGALADAVDVTVIGKKLRRNGVLESLVEQIVFEVALENRTRREVARVEGALTFTSADGEVLAAVPVRYRRAIAAGGIEVHRLQMDHNSLRSDHTALAETPLPRLAAEWKPEVVVFGDGERWAVEGSGER